MNGQHTVEKIGGTCMSRFGDILRDVIIAGRRSDQMYQRIFVVSAYSGVTNALLEDKKTGAPGVYASFAAGQEDWPAKLEKVRAMLKDYNRKFASLGLDQGKADAFVDQRIDGTHSCLNDMMRVRSYGHLKPADYLPATCEMLSALGEAHSAYNTTLILQAHQINAVFVDLSRWRDTEVLPLNEVILLAFRDLDLATQLPIVTGYVKCDVGIMTHFSRGYSEITFSRIAALTNAKEGIIHKEFHLSTGDPVLVGLDKVRVIGNTNYDIADEMSDMNMEAIHARASKEMQLRHIPIRVKNAFEPNHPGTLIGDGFVSAQPKIDLVSGRDDIIALDVKDSEMVGQTGYDHKLLTAFVETGISYITKNTSANSITHYFPEKSQQLDHCVALLKERLPEAEIKTHEVALVSIMGTNMASKEFLAQAAQALAQAGVDVLGVNQSMHRVCIQFVIARQDCDTAQLALHRAFVENGCPN